MALRQTTRFVERPLEQGIATVTADGALDYCKCSDAIAALAVACNEILRISTRVGRTIWRRWSGCNRRIHAKARMHCVKLRGQRLSTSDLDRQVAEFQARVAVLNRVTALGTAITEVADRICQGKGEPSLSPAFCK